MVTLRPITAENWVECVCLRVTEEQQQAGFVSPNAVSLAQAFYEPWWRPLGVYAEETMVGFFLYGRWPESDIPAHHGETQPGLDCILRVMIDARYQGKGYGFAALTLLVEQILVQPGCQGIELSYEPSNQVAERLYAKIGFQPTGRLVEGEVQMILPARSGL